MSNNLSYRVFNILLLVWPFYLVGTYSLSAYPITLPLILYIAFAISLFNSQRLDTGTKSLYYFVFIVYVFLIRLVKVTSLNAALSSVLLSIFLIPFIYKSSFQYRKVNDFRKSLKYLKTGLYVTFFVLLLEVIYYFLFKQKIQLLLPFDMVDHFGFDTFYRMRYHSTFDEPAHYSIYLFYCYLILDISNIKYSIDFLLRDKVLIIVSILLSQSLIGFILIVIYFLILRNVLLGKKGLDRILFLFKRTFITILLLLFLTVSISFLFPDLFSYVSYRFNSILDIAGNSMYSGEGSRVNAILLVKEFISNGNFVFGEGEINLYKILPQYFGLGENLIPNSLVAVLIYFGLVGLFLYALFTVSIFRKMNTVFFVLFVLQHFILGFWISILFWIPFLIIYQLFNNEKKVISFS